MAAGHTNYTRGEMDVNAHRNTFSGFMALTKYGGAFIVVTLLFPILYYGTVLGWFPSLTLSLIVGILLGLILRLKGAWYATIIALAVIAGIMCFIFSLFS